MRRVSAGASIYRILTGDCNPTLDTLLSRYTRALRLRPLKVQPAEAPGPSPADAYTYRVVLVHRGACLTPACAWQYPELSFLDSTSEGAFAGIRRLVSQHVGNAAAHAELASDKGLRTPTAERRT